MLFFKRMARGVKRSFETFLDVMKREIVQKRKYIFPCRITRGSQKVPGNVA
jgi:hypothetical protein